ncbi:DUF4136 domain-containing protein [Altericroceibacterium spongiae]|nr:DUF4136 domain-containing protein [Altericroceibacterium spongiae]
MAAIPLLLASLAACASPFQADVSRFQSQLPAPEGQTFAVVAEDPSLSGGLEFSMYADYVDQQMERLGYREAASPDSANLIVRFDYGVDNGRERIRSDGPSSYWGPWYGYGSWGPYGYYPRRSWSYGWYDPFFDRPSVSSYTVYTSDVEMKIDRASDGKRLFEGRAEAVSTSDRLQYLVPNLVEAMFTDFPGNSGETVRISIAPENQPVKRSSK